MFAVLIFGIILVVALPGCNGGVYTILASKAIHSLSEYRVAVSRTADGQGAVNLEIEGKGYREAQLATLEGFSTSIVTFKIGVLNPGDYTLTARAVYGEEFLSKVPLVSMNKTYCVFLHTDKTVYEAGDVIMFRVVVLNKHLKPLANIKPGMVLKDGNSHVLKQWGKLPLTKGVFSEEIQIAEFPVLGDWSFEVEVNEQIYTKRILVADFVLPKFNLNIDAPEHVYYPDGSFPVTISARQFSGEEVEGELTVTAYPVFYSGVIQPVFQAPLRRVEHLKGRLALQLSLGSELNLREGEAATGVGGGRGGRRLVLEASVEEALTGRRHNVSALLWLHRTRSYISHQAPKFYNPGLPYTILVQVSDWENLETKGNGRMLVKYGFPSGSEPMMEVTLPLNSEGRLTYTFYPDDKSNTSPMTIELTYNDLKEVISNIMPSPGQRENLIQLSLVTPLPEVGKEVHVKINSTAPMKTLIYYVLGRGEIIFSKTFQIIPARRTDELKFQATQAMAPEAVLLVFHVSETSEMEIASIQFQVHGIFQNKVEVKLSPEQPEPLGNVDLRITAEPDSYVAVMAAAPSPMFSVASDHHYDAGQGDGLSVDTVLAQVRSFSPFHEELKHVYREIGNGVARDTINELGLALLSDNYFNKGTRELDQSRSTPDVRHDESTRPPLAGPYAFSRLPVPPSPRVYLGALPTKTWLFANITVGSEGKGLLGRRLPASPGASWGVGAWAVHPVRGLGLATPFLPPATVRPSLRAAAPRVLREGEVLALPASLFNPTNNEVRADVTLHNTRQEFRFEGNNELDAPKSVEPHQRQKLTVPPGRSGTVVFFISVPPSAGPAGEDTRTITLQLDATGVGLADSYEHEIIIMPAGEEESVDASDLLDISTGSASTNLSLPAPTRARARQRAQLPVRYAARAWGWALAPALASLPERASLPPPSGYHNMLPYMDAAVLLQALDSSAQLSDSVKATCLELMHQIYQQQLAYLQDDGSFSLHRAPYQEGSIWVTAFTTRWLGLGMGTARRDADVPAGVVRNALKWLSARQKPDGHWIEVTAQPAEDALQKNSLVLTATTLFAFLDTKHLTLEEYSNTVNKAQDWLAQRVSEAGTWSAAVLAPVAAALAAARHPTAIQATNILSSMANVTDGVRWWEINEQREGGNPLRHRGRSGLELSTVAWAAQALLLQGLRPEAAQLARALLGGLRAGPAPAPAPLLPALARLAQAGAGGAGGAATLEFRCPAGNDTTLISVNKANYLLVQEQEVRDKQCSVSAQGSGTVVASLKARRRTNVTATWPRFSLDPRVDSISTAHHLQLTICVGFVTETGENNSGPVLMEMRLPSGFDIDVDLPALLASGKVRSGHVGETLRLVLAPLGPHETCLTLGAPRLHAVAKEHPGVITVTDLDDDSRRARVFFSPIGGSGLCDVCWGERCQGPCRDPARRPQPLSPGGQVGPSFFPEEAAENNSSAISVQPFALITTVAIIFSNTCIRMFGNN